MARTKNGYKGEREPVHGYQSPVDPAAPVAPHPADTSKIVPSDVPYAFTVPAISVPGAPPSPTRPAVGGIAGKANPNENSYFGGPPRGDDGDDD